MYALKHKTEYKYVTGTKTEVLKSINNLQRARIFLRKCDAHKVKKYFPDYELVRVKLKLRKDI